MLRRGRLGAIPLAPGVPHGDEGGPGCDGQRDVGFGERRVVGVVGAATTEQGCVVNIQSTSSGSTYVYPNSTDDNIEADAEL